MSFRSSLATFAARLLPLLLATVALLGMTACRDEGTGLQMASTLLAEIAGSEKPAAEPSRVLDAAGSCQNRRTERRDTSRLANWRDAPEQRGRFFCRSSSDIGFQSSDGFLMPGQPCSKPWKKSA